MYVMDTLVPEFSPEKKKVQWDFFCANLILAAFS